MNVSGIGQNYNYWGTAANYMQKKTPVKEAISKTAEQPVNLSISDKGRDALREMVSKFEPAASDDTNVKEMTIKNTNEIAWEHYMAMRGISSLTLKDGYSIW